MNTREVTRTVTFIPEAKDKPCPFSTFPKDLFPLFFSFLDHKGLKTFRFVCRAFRDHPFFQTQEKLILPIITDDEWLDRVKQLIPSFHLPVHLQIHKPNIDQHINELFSKNFSIRQIYFYDFYNFKNKFTPQSLLQTVSSFYNLQDLAKSVTKIYFAGVYLTTIVLKKVAEIFKQLQTLKINTCKITVHLNAPLMLQNLLNIFQNNPLKSFALHTTDCYSNLISARLTQRPPHTTLRHLMISKEKPLCPDETETISKLPRLQKLELQLPDLLPPILQTLTNCTQLENLTLRLQNPFKNPELTELTLLPRLKHLTIAPLPQLSSNKLKQIILAKSIDSEKKQFSLTNPPKEINLSKSITFDELLKFLVNHSLEPELRIIFP